MNVRSTPPRRLAKTTVVWALCAALAAAFAAAPASADPPPDGVAAAKPAADGAIAWITGLIQDLVDPILSRPSEPETRDLDRVSAGIGPTFDPNGQAPPGDSSRAPSGRN